MGNYCAGLWTDFPEGLAWYCSKGSVARRGRGGYPYQAPTWSWASIRGAVSHYNMVEAYQPQAKILDVTCTKRQDAEIDEAQSYRLRVSGPSISAVLSQPDPETVDIKLAGIRWLRTPGHAPAEGASPWTGFYPDDIASATPPDGVNTPVWCLLIGIWMSAVKPECSINYVLVLKESEHVPHTYERIGLTNGWVHWSQRSQEMVFDIV